MAQQHPSQDSPAGRDDAARVSVVVPSYNHARFVETTLRSVFRQTLQPAELLVIDDGSADDSPRRIEKMLKDCPFPCELIARGNRGLCATLNEGLSKTSGKYFSYLGSDDLWLEGFLRARFDLLESRPRAALGYGHTYYVDGRNRIVDCTKDWAEYSDGDARAMLFGLNAAPMSPTVMYRRDALARHGWNETARLEDYELYLRLSAEGEFAFDPRVLSAWRRHEENASWNQRMMLEEHLAAQRRALPALGMSPDEIEKLQARIRFNRAEDFLRIGDKREALRLMSRNLGGATSARTLARILLRLLIPFPLMRRRTRRLQRRATERYGSIHL
ncbi:MAG: glycosyltransferase [Rubrivivax sp.]|nr:glycosyltransferase [Pyrinomonadaceae bacterium]